MEKVKQYIVIVLFGLFLFGFGVAHFLLPDKSFSPDERKELAQFPAASGEALLNGEFASGFETYLLEQFPLRDEFLDCKRWMDKNIFLMSSSGGYVNVENHLTKENAVLDAEQIKRAIAIFNKILQEHPEINQAYYAIIPDKNYYMSQLVTMPTLDYEALFAMMEELNAEKIELQDYLNLDHYYHTDSHWKQETLLPLVEGLCEGLGVKPADPNSYSASSLEGFKGVYYGLATNPPAPDTLTYLLNDTLRNAIVKRLNNQLVWEEIQVYNESNFGQEGMDSYDVFLEGPEMLITIENPNADTDKELIMFRDSFSSSLAPLLVDSYAKITMIDLRYIKSYALNQVDIDFEGADVIFLYSTTMINSAMSAGMG